MMSANADPKGSGIGNKLAVQQLRCEYETNPLGIDVQKPRLSWVLASTLASPRRGAAQSAYRVRVTEGQNELWDSGKVSSDRSIHVPYGGPALRSGQR